MCCLCHYPGSCLGCSQPIGWHHRWHCQVEGAFVTEEDCCQERENHEEQND